ncbi:MAG: stage V sporulation protein AC [Clostridia bacterium]|nr:stage V sporulation protein AC [Clostridia bacterium]
MNISDKQYGELVKKASPSSPLFKNCIMAFLVGGGICCLGQVLFMAFERAGMDNQETRTMVSVTLIVIAAILTGIGVFDKIAKHAGAGTVVPITGFSNSVVSPALEYKSEGFVMGTGANIFKISGPVIAYGTLSATLFGLVYYIVQKVMS